MARKVEPKAAAIAILWAGYILPYRAPAMGQMPFVHHLFLIISLPSLSVHVSGQGCGGGLSLSYAKIPNMLPRSNYPPELLFAQAPGVAITPTCYNRCRDSPNCDGFIMDYKQGACYRVNIGRQFEEYQYQPNVNFFRKICLKIPRECAERAWPVEYVPGYRLLAEQHLVLPNVVDKWQCAQMCLNQSTIPCRSAQYQVWSRTCMLSEYDRHTSPDLFSPVITSEREFEYIENQCPLGYSYGQGINMKNNEYCWRDALYNKTTMRPDLEIDNLNINQCEWRCQNEKSFRCFAYTFQCPAFGNRISRCLLHTDEVQAMMSPLVSMPCTTYREKISCLDVSISCSPQSMVVTLNEKMFAGQMFVAGHASDCSSSNTGGDQLQLVIPLPETEYGDNVCDVQISNSVRNENRSVISAVIVIQHHKLIQTVSDRVIKVSCYVGDNNVIGPTPLDNNLTLNASIYIKDPIPVQNVIEGYGNDNTATYPPSAVMRIVDIGKGNAVTSQTELGDELELQIFVSPSYNVSMIRAGHLIASSGSGQDSLLLLDWRGCPPDPATFPPLSPINETLLVARFRAFKFPDSNILRFSVVLTFCVSICQPTDCGNGMTSYGKRRRRAVNDVMEEVPLQLQIIVKSASSKSEAPPRPQLANNSTEVTRSINTDIVCASFGSTLLLGTGWILLQILILLCCCWSLGQRENKSDRISLETDFQPKPVHWEDSFSNSHLSSNYLQESNETSTPVRS